MKRVYLSPPDLRGGERERVAEALDSNWVAPLGPQVDAFEAELAGACGVEHAAALSSGTAALHLAMILLGVGSGDEVFCSTFTFAASANPIVYQGARPVFIDADEATWTMDPGLLEGALSRAAVRRKLPRAVISVDLYGQCCNYARIGEVCRRYDVPLVEDAAEALGATCNDRPAGSFGRLGILSFNGNKIITTSSGGALLSDDRQLIERARFLATQSRDPAPHYEHSVIGYNYRMSNVLAAIGRAQLATLDARLERRRRNFGLYVTALSDLSGVSFMPEAPYGRANRWLTCLRIDPAAAGVTREDVRRALEAENIEARPVWKPLHLQPVFNGFTTEGGSVAAQIFDEGLCLPSGSNLTDEERERTCAAFRRCFRR